jgi:hypothetical protein
MAGAVIAGAVIGERGAVIATAPHAPALPPATWRTAGGAANQAELPGAAKGAETVGTVTAVTAGVVALAVFLATMYRVSASSSSAASAHERVPSRSPIQMGSLSLKGEMELKSESRPLEPIPRLRTGVENVVEVMDERTIVFVLVCMDSPFIAGNQFQFLFEIDIIRVV